MEEVVEHAAGVAGDVEHLQVRAALDQARGQLVAVHSGHEDVGDHGPDWGAAELLRREPRPDLAPDPALPADTRLWAALQHASGGVWGGCVYDPDAIIAKLAGK